MFCQDTKHQLHGWFMSNFRDEQKKYVKEKKLCYGCMKPGYSVKDWRHRRSCDTCKGKQPTCLHDDNFVKRENPAPLAMATQGNMNETMHCHSM